MSISEVDTEATNDLLIGRIQAVTDAMISTDKMHPRAPWDALALTAIGASDEYMANHQKQTFSSIRQQLVEELAKNITSPIFGPLMCTDPCGNHECRDDIRLQMVKEIQIWLLEQTEPQPPIEYVTKEALTEVLEAMKHTSLTEDTE